jgi:hypothetical protein
VTGTLARQVSSDIKPVPCERAWALAERARVVAEYEQALIDAEVTQTRRALVRSLRTSRRTPATVFLEPAFLAVADRAAIATAVVQAAMSVTDACAVDLELYGVVVRPGEPGPGSLSEHTGEPDDEAEPSAVRSYELFVDGQALGVLSFHYSEPLRPSALAQLVAQSAGYAFTR